MDSIDDTAGASAPPRHSLVPVDVPGPAVGSIGEDAQMQLMRELRSGYPVLLHWIAGKLGDRELAADLLNDAVVIALEQQRSGRPHRGGNLAGHVFKIGMKLLRNQRRKLEDQPHLHLASDAARPVSQPASADTGHDEQMRQAVRHLLQSLSSEREREIVTQFYLDGADKDSLCRKFAVSGVQFNAIVARARRRMKALQSELCRTAPG